MLMVGIFCWLTNLLEDRTEDGRRTVASVHFHLMAFFQYPFEMAAYLSVGKLKDGSKFNLPATTGKLHRP